jgi:hypothetical protein
MRRVKAPEVAAFIEARFMGTAPADKVLPLPSSADPFSALSSHYLGSLAFAFYAQASGSAEFWTRLAKQAEALGSLEQCDFDNLKLALEARGMAMPANVTAAKELQ